MTPRKDIIFEKYLIIRTLWKNEQGIVYLTRHKGLESLRVVKVIKKGTDSGYRGVREARFLKILNHSGIPVIYDVEEDYDNVYIVEEYMEGISLRTYVSEKISLSIDETLKILRDVCQIVSYLHNLKPKGILHLDIKPDNILITSNGIKLIDYGNSLYFDENANENIGTPGYASPEQTKGGTLDERTDIYALGAVLLYMSTGVEKSISQIQDINLKAITERCLKDNPKERYQRVEDIIKEIDIVTRRKKLRQLSLRIGVIGTKAGIGTTHVALLLAREMRHRGYLTILKEENASKAIAGMIDFYNKKVDKNGTCVIKGCPLMPEFNQAVNVNDDKKYEIEIIDMGVFSRNKYSKADVQVLVGSFTSYEYARTLSIYDELRKMSDTICVVNYEARASTVLRHQCGRPDIFSIAHIPFDRAQDKRLSGIVKRLVPLKRYSLISKIRSKSEDVFKIFKKKRA